MNRGLTEYGVGTLANVWRKGDGIGLGDKIVLGVSFLDGDAGDKQLVIDNASRWLDGPLGTKLAFEFGVDQAQSQISVTFNSNSNWSRIGRKSANYSKQSASLNIKDKVSWVIAHEFGHALGLRHEQSHPENTIQWNEPVVLAAYAQMGISEETVRDQVFKRFGMDQRCGPFDPKSIMMYEIPSSWTLDGFSTDAATQISAGDRSCINALYDV